MEVAVVKLKNNQTRKIKLKDRNDLRVLNILRDKNEYDILKSLTWIEIEDLNEAHKNLYRINQLVDRGFKIIEHPYTDNNREVFLETHLKHLEVKSFTTIKNKEKLFCLAVKGRPIETGF